MYIGTWKKILQAGIVFNMVLMVAIGVFCVASAFAGESISARYTHPRGGHIKWKIKIPKSLPAAVIVIQYIRPGTEILESSHPLSSYDKEKGIAKWLITPSSSTTLRMDMKISKHIRKKGEIRGEVMFKDESQNTTASIFMEPKARKSVFEGC